MKLPRHWLRHVLLVEPYLGEGGAGPLYGPAVRLRCHLSAAQESRRRGTDRDRRESTRCLLAVADADRIGPDARVTLPGGRRVEVASRRDHTYPGAPVPEHVELTLT